MTKLTTTIEALAAQHPELTPGEVETLHKALQGNNPAPTPTNGPPKAPKVTTAESVLAVEALVRQGVPRVEAQGAVLHGDLEAFRTQIDAERDRLQAQADEQAAAGWALTPEGKAHGIVTREAERQAVHAHALLARKLLAENGFGDTDDLSDQDAINLSGIDRDDSDQLLQNDPRANAERIAAIEARVNGGESSE